MINAELLLTTLEHIDANRSQWDQGDWRTCFAAHACLLAGGRWAIPEATRPELAMLLKPARGDRRNVVTVEVDGCEVRGTPVSVRARRVLGLTDGQASRLFRASNDLHTLFFLVSELVEQAKEAAA
jgi:hypothetical protein